MPNVLKRFLSGGEASDYVFRPAAEFKVEPQRPAKPQKKAPEKPPAAETPPPPSESEKPAEKSFEAPEATPETDPIYFAKIQANAILADAQEEADRCKKQALAEAEAEIEEARRAAKEEGYSRGYAEGMANAMQEGKLERERMALEQVKAIEAFLEGAARARDRVLDDAREELKDLAVAVAEKVIHVSLKNSSDIILRMVDAATDTHKRCEWAHIYVADCDVGGKAYTVPELTAALSHIAERVRVIPMPDEESGTCIVELPDVILDASVSTQLENIKDVLDGVVLEND